MNQKEREKLEQIRSKLNHKFIPIEVRVEVAIDDLDGLLAKTNEIVCEKCKKNEVEIILLHYKDGKQIKLCRKCYDDLKWNLITNDYWRKK